MLDLSIPFKQVSEMLLLSEHNVVIQIQYWVSPLGKLKKAVSFYLGRTRKNGKGRNYLLWRQEPKVKINVQNSLCASTICFRSWMMMIYVLWLRNSWKLKKRVFIIFKNIFSKPPQWGSWKDENIGDGDLMTTPIDSQEKQAIWIWKHMKKHHN